MSIAEEEEIIKRTGLLLWFLSDGRIYAFLPIESDTKKLYLTESGELSSDVSKMFVAKGMFEMRAAVDRNFLLNQDFKV